MNKFDNLLSAANQTVLRAERETRIAVEAVWMRHAYRMLDLFRELLAEHKTHNHEIRLVTGMGTAFLTIDGRLWTDFSNRFWRCPGNQPIFNTLKWIAEQLDHAWDYHIPNNTLLNEPKEPKS